MVMNTVNKLPAKFLWSHNGVCIISYKQGVPMLTDASRHQYSISNDISPETFGLEMLRSMKERWRETKMEVGGGAREKECNRAEYAGLN